MADTKPPGAPRWLPPVSFIALIAASIGLWFLVFGSPSKGADPSDPEQVALGRQIYAEHCASCHGVDLEGQPNWRERGPDGLLPAPPHDETGHTWHHPDDMLFDIVKRGPAAVVGNDYKSAMPGYADSLSDAEIWASLAYIKSRWPARVRAAQAGGSH